MISETQREKVALLIVEVLHENKIPIDSIQSVFADAAKMIFSNTFTPDPKTLKKWDELGVRAAVEVVTDTTPGGIVFKRYEEQYEG